MSNSVAAMRPRLRSGVFFAPAESGNGALVSRGDEVVELRGASTYAWLARLAPRLDGKFSLGELLGSLDEKRRRMATRLIEVLAEANFVRDMAADLPHSLTPAELTRFAAQIEFVEAFRDSPAQRFEKFRASRILLAGAGTTLVHAALAALEAGAGRLTVAATNEAETDLGLLWRRAGESTCALMDLRDRDAAAELPVMAEDFHVVMYVTDRVDSEIGAALSRCCGDSGKVFVPAVVLGDSAWIGPVQGEHRPRHRWTGLWDRLGGAEAADPRDCLAGPVPGIIGNHAVFTCFEQLTGVADETGPVSAVRIDLETLRTSVHAVPPDLTVGSAANPGTDVIEALLPEVTDERLGVFSTPSEQWLRQFPLRVVQVEVNLPPTSLAAGVPESPVRDTGLDYATARDRAVLRATAQYSRYAIDPHRLLSAEDSPLRSDSPAGVGELIEHAWLLGTSLVGGEPVLVPAATVVAPGVAWPTGLAAARDFDSAVVVGLLEHCLAHAVDRVAADGTPRPGIDPHDQILGPNAERLLELLDIAGQNVAVHDLSLVPDVPVYSFRLDTGDLTCRAGLTTDEVLEAGLEWALAAYQAAETGQHEILNPPGPTVLVHLLGETLAAPRSPATAVAPGERCEILVKALDTAGGRPAVVQLDHDPALAGGPSVVRVVLLDV